MTRPAPLPAGPAPLTHDQMAARAARYGALFHARNVLTQLRAWAISLFAIGTIEPLITVLALGVGLGVVVDATSPDALGVPFLQFVAPALVLTVAARGAQVENTFTVMGGFKWNQLYLAIFSTATSATQLVTGHWLGCTLRYIINCATVSGILLLFGAVTPAGALILLPVAVLTAWAFGNPIMAWAATLTEDKGQFALLARVVILPLTLFSGTYFPLEVLPGWMHPIGWVSPLWHGVNLTRILTLGQAAPWWLPAAHVLYLGGLALAGWLVALRIFELRLLGHYPKPRPKQPTDTPRGPAASRPSAPLPSGQQLMRRPRQSALWSGNPLPVAARGLKANWGVNSAIMLSGVLEPILYLLAMGLGLGTLIGGVEGSASYAAWIAPALLASSAMMGAVMDSTWNVFMKLKFSKLYESMLSTSLGPMDVAVGEIAVALTRGGVYAVAFVGVMAVLGLVGSWWVLLAIPACLLIAFGFAALGMAATSFCRTFQQVDWVFLALMPMFMFSGTFYPVEVYPEAIATVVKLLPLWHGIEMLRELNAGQISWATGGHALYFAILAGVGIQVATLRLKALFLR